MHKQSAFDFNMMALTFKFRDWFHPPQQFLKEAGVKPGFHVLDYGCGPGSYTFAATKFVGQTGTVYAVDNNPLAIERIQKVSKKKKKENVNTILTNCKTELPDNSIDVVLLYDTYHEISDPDCVIKELYRLLKPEGILSFSDHHMTEDQIISQITKKNHFKFLRQQKKTYLFVKT